MMPTPETILQLIGDQPYQERLLIDDQSTQDIIDCILTKHEICRPDYDKFAYLFQGGTVPQVCRRIYDFCKQNFSYFVESYKKQYTSKPATMLQRAYNDCKGYSLFIAGVLDSLDRQGYYSIDWCFRFASYKLFKVRPGHVFIVVRYQGQEIWIDPVFDTFNYRGKPYMYAKDYYPAGTAEAISGLCCDAQGRLGYAFPERKAAIGTGQQTGLAIEKIVGAAAPALLEIPVAGWAIVGAGELTGFFLTVFGSKYSSSSGVRWLEQMFDYYVRAMPGVTSDNKVPGTTQDINAAQDWFGYVLGVPIYDKYRWHALRGENGDTGAKLGISQTQMVQNYLSYPDVQQAGVTYDQALQASNIALGMRYQSGDPPGIWANMLAAPGVVQSPGSGSIAPGVLTAAPATTGLFQKPLTWIILGVAAILILSNE